MTQKYTPGPWKVINYENAYSIENNDLSVVFYCSEMNGGSTIHKANAEFIVRAVNSHDDLLEALKIARDMLEQAKSNSYFTLGAIKNLTQIDSVLAKATKGE